MNKQQIFTGMLVLTVLALAVVAGLAVRLSARGEAYAQEPDSLTRASAQAVRVGIAASTPLSTSFTYQGQLKLNGELVNSACDFQFRLYDAASLGNQVGITQTESITVTDGLFTVNLDFGDVFTGTARWLGIRVMCTDLGDTEYADLGRQELTAAPYALNADLLDGQHASEFVTEIALEASDLHNMVTNASFEWFATAVPDYWDLVEAGVPNVISQTVPGYDGAYAVRLTDATSAGFCIQQEVYTAGMLPDHLRGRLLALSVWARQIDDMRPAGEISLSDGISRTAVLLENNTEWHRAVLTHQVQLSGTMLLVELCPVELAADTGAYDFDAVMLTVGSFDPPFAPGLRNTFWEIGGNDVDSDAVLGTNNDQPLSIQANGTETIYVTSNGRVGVGSTPPGSYRLYVDGGSDDGIYTIYADGGDRGLYAHGDHYGAYSYAEGSSGIGVYGSGGDYGVKGNASQSSGIGVYGYSSGSNGVEGVSSSGNGVKGESASNDGVDGRSTSGNGVYGRSTNGTGVCGRSDSGSGCDFEATGSGTNYCSFTGGHDVKLSGDFPEDVKPGMIIVVTGETQVRKINEEDISFSSTLPTVQLCDTPNDSSVFGVLIAERPLGEKHWYTSGEGERFGIANALGEGRVWVTNVNGDIQAGDYITTSSIPGYGQRQDDDLLHSYTLGKAIEDVDWSQISETVELDGQMYKVFPIAVVYTSG